METCGPCECKIWYPRLAVMCLGFEEATNPGEFRFQSWNEVTFGLNTSESQMVNIRIQKYMTMPIWMFPKIVVPPNPPF